MKYRITKDPHTKTWQVTHPQGHLVASRRTHRQAVNLIAPLARGHARAVRDAKHAELFPTVQDFPQGFLRHFGLIRDNHQTDYALAN